MRKYLFFSLLVSAFLTTIAQMPFALKAQVEPNGVQKIKELPSKEVMTIAKVKGNQQSPSIYVLQKLTAEFDLVWEEEILLEKTENITNWEIKGKNVDVFTTLYDTEAKTSILFQHIYELEKGTFVKKDTLLNLTIAPWHNEFGKSKVFQTFDNAIASVSPPTYLTPLEYQYNVTFSPNQQMTLVYHYVFSEKELYAWARVYDVKNQLVAEGKAPIDLNFISYPFAVNNRGEVILTKVTSSGKIALIQYDLRTKNNRYINLEASNSTRDNLQVQFLNDDEGYLVALNKKNGQFTGVTCAKFSFKEEKIVRHSFQLLDIEYQNEIRKAQKEKHIKQDYDLFNFKLIDFFVDAEENIFMTTEQQSLIGEGINYQDNIHEQVEKWAYFPSRVNTNTAIIWALNKDFDIRWRYFLVKEQSTGTIDGTNTTSISVHHSPKETQIIYALSPKQITFNEIHYVVLDGKTGKEKKSEMIVTKLTLARVYCFWTKKHELVWVGKKGLVGKKTFIQKNIGKDD